MSELNPQIQTHVKYVQEQQFKTSINIEDKKYNCTKQVIFIHENVCLNSGDFSDSPSFLKMSLENTPMLKKRALSQYDKQMNTLEQQRLDNQVYQSKTGTKQHMQTTIKTCKRQPIVYQQFYSENSVDKTNKQNIQNIRNKKMYRPTNINENQYQIQNLIKIVDNMYEKAIEKKIQCNVNIQMTNKKISQTNNFQKQISSKQTNLFQQKKIVEYNSKKVPLIQIQQLKLKAKNRQNQKRFQILSSASHSKENYQKYCKIIEEEDDDRHLTQTQRVSIEILPQEDQNQYKCKEQQPQQEQIQYQQPLYSHRSNTLSLGNSSQQSQQFTYRCVDSESSEYSKQRSQNINRQVIVQRKQRNYNKSLFIKNASQKKLETKRKQKTKLINYTVSKYNQTLKTKMIKNEVVQQMKPKIYIPVIKYIQQQKKPFTFQQNPSYQEQQILQCKTNRTQSNSKRVYEQILSGYTTAKLLSLNKKLSYNKTINKLDGQENPQQNNTKKRSSSLTHEPKIIINSNNNRFISQQKNKNIENNQSKLQNTKFIKKLQNSNSLEKQRNINNSKNTFKNISNARVNKELQIYPCTKNVGVVTRR